MSNNKFELINSFPKAFKQKAPLTLMKTSKWNDERVQFTRFAKSEFYRTSSLVCNSFWKPIAKSINYSQTNEK